MKTTIILSLLLVIDAIALAGVLLAMTQESSVVYQALIAAVVTIVLAWMSNRTARMVKKTADEAAAKAEDAAKKVVEVKTTLDDNTVVQVEKLDAIAEIGTATRDTVNHLALIQLKLLGQTQRRIAELTKDPKDAAIADATDKLIAAHEEAEEKIAANKLREIRAAHDARR